MAVLSKLAQIPASSPSSPFGKDSQTSAQKAGTRDDGPTGPATSKRPGNQPGEFAGTVRSAPGSGATDGALYTGFRRQGKGKWSNWAGHALDISAPATVFPGQSYSIPGILERSGGGHDGSIHISGAGIPGRRHGQGAGGRLSGGSRRVRGGRRRPRREADGDHLGRSGRNPAADRECPASADGSVHGDLAGAGG